MKLNKKKIELLANLSIFTKIKKMKCIFFIITMLFFLGCQTTKIKSDSYITTSTNTELGSIGEHNSSLDLKKKFIVRAIPKLDNEIRLSIEIVPFNKSLAKVYESKVKYNQGQTSINYNDSVPIKPELATIKVLDILGVVQELNGPQNKDLLELLHKSRLEFISGVAIVLPIADLAKIREADAYYLNNDQPKKYTISLMKQGKKIGALDLTNATVIGNTISRFCWSEDQKGKWFIADISEKGCSGKMKSRPKKIKASKNLFKL